MAGGSEKFPDKRSTRTQGHRSITRGADARQIGAEWRHRSKAKTKLRDTWLGEIRCRCDACGSMVRASSSDLGTTQQCRCGHLVKITTASDDESAKTGNANLNRWIAGMFALVLVGALGTIFYLAQSKDNLITDQTPITSVPRVLPTAKEADQIIDDFLSAETLEKKLASIRFASVMKQSVLDFYAERGSMKENYKSFHVLGETNTSTASFVRYAVTYPDGKERLLAVVATETGPKIDWPTFCRFDHRLWKPFLTSKETVETSFRIILFKDNYYNYAFSDDKRYQCYRLESPDLAIPIYGYALKGSEDARKLSKLLRIQSSPKVILRLRRDAGTPPKTRQVLITEFEVARWTRPTGEEPPPNAALLQAIQK